MSDITKFISRIYQTFVNLVYSDNKIIEKINPPANSSTPAGSIIQATTKYSYITVCTNGKFNVPLEEYFQGSHNDELAQKILSYTELRRHKKPLFDNLYDASYHLFCSQVPGKKTRYILVIAEPSDKVLTLLKNSKEDFHHKIIGAINHNDLIGYIKNQGYDPLQNKNYYEKIDYSNNSNIEFINNDQGLSVIQDDASKQSLVIT